MHRPFRYLLRVRYGECDAQRVVFNVHYGHYVDLAALEFMRALGFENVLVKGHLDYQLVKQTIEWKASARFDQVLEVSVNSRHLGNTSFSLLSEFRLAGAPEVIATAETVYVLVDAKTLAKTSLPDDLREALGRGAPDVCIDHAGSAAGQS